jgi:hypothetical protein
MTSKSIGACIIAVGLTMMACSTRPATKAGGDYEGWKTYRSEWEGASFRYPSDWTIVEGSIDLGEGRAAGQMVVLTSPQGSKVSWRAPLSEVGGGCEPSQKPHIFIERLLDTPTTGSRNPLRVAVLSLEGHKSLGVVDTSMFEGRLEIGDTGGCLVYPTFKSAPRASYSIQFITGEDVQIGNGAMSQDGSERLTVDEYLDRHDIAVSLKIFQSLRY